MATTGELPPSARAGQAFIHDPKVADVTEIKAQIKLRFRDVRRQPCVVTRSFQLTQKSAGKLEKKDLDQVIQTLDQNTGERVSVSRKCADINATVPDMMGVSKAILENVVFVHQEDSNWPLGEAATLKKKFDEIFSATKYTKALEHINKLKKEQNVKIKEFRLVKEKLRVQKDHAVKLRARHDEDSARASALGDRMRALDGKIKEAQSVVDGSDERIAHLRKISERRGQLEARREAIVAENVRRREALRNELDDSDEKLAEFYENFNEQIATTKRELDATERKMNDARLEMAAHKERREMDLRVHGKLSAEAEAQSKRLSDRAAFLSEMIARHPGVGAAPALLAADASEVRAKAEALLERHRGEADALRSKHRAEDDARAAEADAANRKIAAAEESVRLRAEQRDAQRRRADHIADELATHAVSDEAVEDVRARAAEAERLFEERRGAGVAAAATAELERVAETTDQLDRQLSKLRAEQDRAAAAGENATKVRLKREELFAKEEAYRALADSRAGRFAAVFGDVSAVPAPENLKAKLKEFIDARAAALETARVAASAADAAADTAATEVTASRAAVDARVAEAADAVRAADVEGDLVPRRAAEGSDDTLPAVPDRHRFAEYAAAVSRTDEAVARLEADLTVTRNLSNVYESFARSAGETRQCPVCRRGLEQVEAFRADMMGKISTLPEEARRVEAEAEALRGRRERLRALAPAAAAHAALVERTIPESLAAVVAAENRAANADAAASAARVAADVAKRDHATAAALAEDADAVCRLAGDAERLRREVADLERSFGASQFTQTQPPGASGMGATQAFAPARAVSAIGADIEEVEARRSTAEREREALTRRRERAEQEVVQLERNARDLREEHMRISARAEKRAALKRELSDIERDEKEALAEAARLEAERAPHVAAGERLAADREAARASAAKLESAADAAARALQRDVDALDGYDRPIAEYVAGGKADALEQIKAAVASAEEKIAACAERCVAHEEDARRRGETMQRTEQFRRDLDDNITLRKGIAEERKLTEELERLAGEMGGSGEDVDALVEAMRRQTQIRDDLRAEYAESQGRVKTHQEAMAACKRELNDPELRGVDKALSRQVLELKTMEMVNSDLDRYHSALDRALMAFHASKMSDINKVVRELWQRTYRGQDIDYIQIRSDAEGAQGRSSYNYRVVMVVGDAELEMRGRCSAGQKVLACLIIRLALAETFCLNCGILALDEPTTNLDAPNADSLARSLIDIMHSRKDQENFQLIVITHDMHFAQVLGQREHADYYWRITKDDQQHSHIECENIYE